jgi:hypothetical protein
VSRRFRERVEDNPPVIQHVEDNSKEMDDIVGLLVQKYSMSLDDCIVQIRERLSGDSMSDDELERFALELPVYLYFAGEGQEALGIREDMAKSIRTESFNHFRSRADGTVADKNTAAELATTEETMVWSAYQRAYKKMKFKIEAGYEVLNSIKKILTRRVAEYEITRDGGGKDVN